MKKTVQGWGLYPKVKMKMHQYSTISDTKQYLLKCASLIPFGNGRSYGDSVLSECGIDMRSHNHFLEFDDEKGILNVESGVLLADILEAFVSRGWFLKVTPGTKLITVGGAIASDIHGKNHHVEGCFSESLHSFRLMLPDGNIEICSKEDNKELFQATCGGMGLTGVILDAKIYLNKISASNIEQITVKTKDLKETFEAFESYAHMPYSVAWIDCLAQKEKLGRCLLMVGDFTKEGTLEYHPSKRVTLPFYFPSFVLNKWSVKIFNFLYYHRMKEKIVNNTVDIDTFFYPLDAIRQWNRIYGKNGFTQYQFILPKENSYEGLEKILETIASSGKGSFLAVLKLYGKENDNWLSFPIEGYSLALDFKIEKGLFELLDKLDEIVVAYNGRIYLTKDVRVSKETFEKGYKNIERFRSYRKTHKLDEKFQSLQSKRVGI